RHAVTRYRVERRFGAPEVPVASLVTCRLETGRTHQIRVHMASIGHPLIGDAEYGAGFRSKAAGLPGQAQAAIAALGRQALHAWLLGFEHPVTRKILRFERDMPNDMKAVIAELSKT